MKPLETTGTVKNERQLILDKPISLPKKSKLKIILFLPEEEGDFNEQQWLHTASQNPSFDFLKDPAEDIYMKTDGLPFHDKR